MAETKPVLAIPDSEPHRYLFHCPACECSHFFQVAPHEGPQWEWNGDTEKPTVTPSIRVRTGPGGVNICHFHIKAGQIEYCGDCTHHLAGKTVALVPWEES